MSKRILLVGSNILGNSTATSRFKSILSSIEKCQFDLIEIHQDELNELKIPSFFKLQAMSTYIVARRKLKQIKHKEYDIIIVITVQPILGIHGFFQKSKVIIWFDSLPLHNSSDTYSRILGFISRQIYQLAFNRIDALLPMSKWANNQISGFKFRNVKLTNVCYIGVNQEQYRPKKTRTVSERTKVIMVANDLKRKGIIEFFSYVIAERLDITTFQFTLVTNDNSPEFEQIASLLKIRIVNGITHLCLNRLISLYHENDIFFLPTKADMLPNVLIEANAAGLPIVTTDVGAISEVVQHGKNGFLAQPCDWLNFYYLLLASVNHFPFTENITDTKFDESVFKDVIVDTINNIITNH